MHRKPAASRRDVLIRSTTTLAAIAAGRVLAQPAPAPAEGRKVGYAIVGIGKLSKEQILPAMQVCKLSKPAAFVTGHPAENKPLAEKYGIPADRVYTYEQFETLKDSPDVQAVYVVLPNSMHAEYVHRAAKIGKHVLCEKPMALTVEQCQGMIDACKRARVKLMVAYRVRYEPYNQAAIQVVRSGQLGKVITIVANAGFNINEPNAANPQWRLKKELAGGGCLMDIGIYALNATRYLTGEEPAEINGLVQSDPNDPRFKEVEGNCNFQIRFPSGILASCTSSYAYGGPSGYRVFFDRAVLELEPAISYGNLRGRIGSPQGTQNFDFPQANHFASEMEHFSQCILEDKEPLTPGEEGLKDVKAITAIYESARTGKTVKL